jgi:putative ABC transport system substrate-binding protein
VFYLGADPVEVGLVTSLNRPGGNLTGVVTLNVEVAALTRGLPAATVPRSFAEVGGLMSYGADGPDSFRRAAAFVVKIFQGGKPADMPVEQPTKFELVINLKTAKALGLDVPWFLQQRADEVIE